MSKLNLVKDESTYQWQPIEKKRQRYLVPDKVYYSIKTRKIKSANTFAHDCIIYIGRELLDLLKWQEKTRVKVYQEKTKPLLIRVAKSDDPKDGYVLSSQKLTTVLSFGFVLPNNLKYRVRPTTAIEYDLLSDHSLVLDLSHIAG